MVRLDYKFQRQELHSSNYLRTGAPLLQPPRISVFGSELFSAPNRGPSTGPTTTAGSSTTAATARRTGAGRAGGGGGGSFLQRPLVYRRPGEFAVPERPPVSGGGRLLWHRGSTVAVPKNGGSVFEDEDAAMLEEEGFRRTLLLDEYFGPERVLESERASQSEDDDDWLYGSVVVPLGMLEDKLKQIKGTREMDGKAADGDVVEMRQRVADPDVRYHRSNNESVTMSGGFLHTFCRQKSNASNRESSTIGAVCLQ